MSRWPAIGLLPGARAHESPRRPHTSSLDFLYQEEPTRFAISAARRARSRQCRNASTWSARAGPPVDSGGSSEFRRWISHILYHLGGFPASSGSTCCDAFRQVATRTHAHQWSGGPLTSRADRGPHAPAVRLTRASVHVLTRFNVRTRVCAASRRRVTVQCSRFRSFGMTVVKRLRRCASRGDATFRLPERSRTASAWFLV